MSFVIAAPDMVMSAATDLANIGSTISAAHAAAAAPTTGVLAAGADEVSAAIAALFSGHGQAFQALNSRAAAFHAQFVQNLTSGGAAYAGADVSAQQSLLDIVNAPTQALLGRPLIGNGTNGGTVNGVGQPGGDGGLLVGDGGAGGNSTNPGAPGGKGGALQGWCYCRRPRHRPSIFRRGRRLVRPRSPCPRWCRCRPAGAPAAPGWAH